MKAKRVLILGASGMIGTAVQQALQNNPHWQAVPATHRNLSGYVQVPYEVLDAPELWALVLRLHDVQAVVNCVGIWNGSRETFERVQYDVPVALFRACEAEGIRVVHVSALGFSPESELPYASTKARADRYLLEHCPDTGNVVYPSLVFGSTGNSSRFFMNLAALPIQADFDFQANLQPVHVDDVAKAVVDALNGRCESPVVEVAGTHRISAAEYFTHLRRGMGLGPATLSIRLPRWCGKALFMAGEAFGAHFVNKQSWTLLEDGTCSAKSFPTARPYDTFATKQDGHAMQENQLYWFARMAMVVLWLTTAIVTWFCWPRNEVLSWLDAMAKGLGTPSWLAASCLLDGTMGMLSLYKPSTRLWKAQFGLTAAYSVGLLVALPWSIAHPFGMLTKNLSVLTVMAYLAMAEKKRGR